jgi:hypothetical protein
MSNESDFTHAFFSHMHAVEGGLRAVCDRLGGIEVALPRVVRESHKRPDSPLDETEPLVWRMRSEWLVDLETLDSPPAESADQ